MSKTRKLRVAAIQMPSRILQPQHNLQQARRWVAQAAKQGAELVLLPELMASGYLLSEAMWSQAESKYGKTVSWLKDTAKAHHIHLGTTYLEAHAGDVFNTFALATPQGELAGQVRKQQPIAMEAYLIAGATGQRHIETDLGRIGISICGEALLSRTYHMLHQADVDFILQPSATPAPSLKFPFRQSDVQHALALLQRTPVQLAQQLAVPVVMANQCGAWQSPMPSMFPDQDTFMMGQSMIVGADGALLASCDKEEGMVLADIDLRKGKKGDVPPQVRGYWAQTMPWYALVLRLSQYWGEKSYRARQYQRLQAQKKAQPPTVSG